LGGCVAGIPVKKRSRLTDRPLLQATEALLFFQRWSIVQGSSTTGGTCLMECGPADQDQCRKWVMDIDGGLAELRAQGFLGEDELCGEEVCSAQRLLGSSGPAPPDAAQWRASGGPAPPDAYISQHRARLHGLVVQFASNISHALHSECFFLEKPCHFAIKSRSI